jgi:hypothetical protein
LNHGYPSASASESVRRRCVTGPLCAACIVLTVLVPHTSVAGAAGAPEPDPAAASPDSPDAETPDSVEQGQVQMPDSFSRQPIIKLLHESRMVGLRDIAFNLQLRNYYLDRVNFDGSDSEAWALGGSAGVKTGYFGDLIAFGATGYTSQRLYGPLDKDGTKLLQPEQQPYTVIAGQLYGQIKLSSKINVTVGRKGMESPFINSQDSLMTPNTFSGYALLGTIGSTDQRKLHFAAGYIDRIKPRNAEDFESMAAAAGAPAGVERGVYVAGVSSTAGALEIGGADYHSADIINITYAEARYKLPLADRLGLRFGAQYADQTSAGSNLLTGDVFSNHQYGLKIELARGPSLFTLARTVTSNGTVGGGGAASDANMRNPWGAYPGYTSVQIQNFDRAGENATLLRAAYNFPTRTGLSVYALWVGGSTPHGDNQYAQQETDVNLKWKPQSGAWTRLTLLARYGHVSQAGPVDQHKDELRLVFYYQLL